MTPEILASIAGALGSFAATLAGIMINSKLTSYRLEQLEIKVDKHNNVIERVYNLEKHGAVVDEELRVANHRISDLEDKI